MFIKDFTLSFCKDYIVGFHNVQIFNSTIDVLGASIKVLLKYRHWLNIQLQFAKFYL